MQHSSWYRAALRSPEDVATFRKWRRGVFIFYAAVSLTIMAAWGAPHLRERGGADQTARTAAPVKEAGHGEHVP